MSRAVAIVCLLTAVGARADTTLPSAAGASTGKPYVVASLERTMCYGTCPAYRLTVLSDGQVEWEGRRFVKVNGKAQATLTPAEMAALKAAFADVHYFELHGKYDCREWTDHPSANTSFDDGTQRNAVRHYHGCKSAAHVDELTALEAKVDRICRTERWVGTEAEREALRRAGKWP
jgi:hypothetical protein